MSRATHSINARRAVGLNCPVSIELIVFRETPTISASCACDSPESVLHSFNLFFSSSLPFMDQCPIAKRTIAIIMTTNEIRTSVI